jgi:hypothetical protein
MRIRARKPESADIFNTFGHLWGALRVFATNSWGVAQFVRSAPAYFSYQK